MFLYTSPFHLILPVVCYLWLQYYGISFTNIENKGLCILTNRIQNKILRGMKVKREKEGFFLKKREVIGKREKVE